MPDPPTLPAYVAVYAGPDGTYSQARGPSSQRTGRLASPPAPSRVAVTAASRLRWTSMGAHHGPVRALGACWQSCGQLERAVEAPTTATRLPIQAQWIGSVSAM